MKKSILWLAIAVILTSATPVTLFADGNPAPHPPGGGGLYVDGNPAPHPPALMDGNPAPHPPGGGL